MAILLDVVLALAKGVPELDRLVARARDDLPVVGAEADRQDIGLVADEATGGEAGVKIPKTEGVVPGRGESELAVGGDDDVRDEVVVAERPSAIEPERVGACSGPNSVRRLVRSLDGRPSCRTTCSNSIPPLSSYL